MNEIKTRGNNVTLIRDVRPTELPIGFRVVFLQECDIRQEGDIEDVIRYFCSIGAIAGDFTEMAWNEGSTELTVLAPFERGHFRKAHPGENPLCHRDAIGYGKDFNGLLTLFVDGYTCNPNNQDCIGVEGIGYAPSLIEILYDDTPPVDADFIEELTKAVHNVVRKRRVRQVSVEKRLKTAIRAQVAALNQELGTNIKIEGIGETSQTIR